ncbi:MAG: DUF2249 domain-containing protein [Halobacteriaceae archaeon]
MDTEDELPDALEHPPGWPVETLDVRDLPPPEPLAETLERASALEEGTVLVQFNDRLPQHLFPKLEDREFLHDSVETAEGAVTAIWHPPAI